MAHEQCLENVKRNCVAMTVDKNPSYILEICPETSLSAQNYTCEECGTHISFGEHAILSIIDSNYLVQYFLLGGNKGSLPILCDYTGKYYCTRCHWNHEALIPARIVYNWDFNCYPVSRASEQCLKFLMKKPLINLEIRNSRLFGFVEELALVQVLKVFNFCPVLV